MITELLRNIRVLHVLKPITSNLKRAWKHAFLPSDEFLLGHALQAFDEEGKLKDAATVEN